jgi:dihydroflavonol-4-reductase
VNDPQQNLDERPVLVTGASGFVGSHTARLLTRKGRKVRVLVRKTSNLAAMQGLPVDIFYGDVLDPDSVRAAMDGCSSVFYSVVDPRFWLSDPTPLYRNNVDGLVNTMDVALACGVEHFIFTSTMGTLGFNPDGPVTEDIPFNWGEKASAYILARVQAEQRFMNYCHNKGLPGVALCVANTYGPEDYQPTPHGNMLWQVGSGRTKRVMDTSAPMVDIRDVAEAAVSAETNGRIGERYIIANEYISNRDFFTMAAQWGGHEPPRLIPHRVAAIVASVAEMFIKLFGIKNSMLSKDAVFLSGAFKEMDNSKARRELHWNPRPVRETVNDALAWYAQHEGQKSGRG